jgi:hypothetical protein
MQNSLLRYIRFRNLDPFQERWAAIHQYNAAISAQLPPGAKEFAFAESHYNYNDPSCPHDSWIKSIEIRTDDSKRNIEAVCLCVLGAFHDRLIFFDYTGITDLSLEGRLVSASGSNPDWIYDEVHLCESGSVEHVIEFEESVIRIECADFRCSWKMLLTGDGT